ncbi:hypothetical protein RFI_21371, partial [Reticulomyxa filosa]
MVIHRINNTTTKDGQDKGQTIQNLLKRHSQEKTRPHLLLSPSESNSNDNKKVLSLNTKRGSGEIKPDEEPKIKTLLSKPQGGLAIQIGDIHSITTTTVAVTTTTTTTTSSKTENPTVTTTNDNHGSNNNNNNNNSNHNHNSSHSHRLSSGRHILKVWRSKSANFYLHNYLIIDDFSLRGRMIDGHFLQTQSSVGMTEDDMTTVIQFFKAIPPPPPQSVLRRMKKRRQQQQQQQQHQHQHQQHKMDVPHQTQRNSKLLASTTTPLSTNISPISEDEKHIAIKDKPSIILQGSFDENMVSN